jgi:hypothetical protein
VRVELPGGSVLTGRATGVDPGGRLIVTGPGGPAGAVSVIPTNAAIDVFTPTIVRTELSTSSRYTPG